MDALFEIDFGNGFVTVAPPINKDAIAIDMIFIKDKARARLQSINFEWVGETAVKINQYKENGLNGGKGIAYGLPLKIGVCGSQNQPLAFDLMLNLGHSAARFECDRVVCPIFEAGGNDWLKKETQAITFWFLASAITDPVGGYKGPGRILFSDFKKTPYSLTTIPDGTQIITLSITALLIGIQIEQSIVLLTSYISRGIAALTPDPSPKPLLAGVYTVLAIAQLLIIIALLNALIKLLKAIVDNIIQLRKYKLCMREADHFLKLAAYIGATFSSTIYGYVGSNVTTDGYDEKFVNATWMPRKVVMPILNPPLSFNFVYDRPEDENGNKKSFGHFEGTAAEWIERMENKYNAEAKMIDGVLHFEEKRALDKGTPYQIPNTAKVGYTFNLPDPHGTNLSELAPYTRLFFQIDESELNTLHRYRGTSVDVTIKNPAFPVNKYSGWGAGKNIDLGSALAKRKVYLNRVEQALDALFGEMFDFMDEVSNLSGIGTPNILDQLDVSKRIGWMELSNDSFSVPKTFIGVDVDGDWEIAPQSEENMSAISLLNNFHGKELPTRGNQWLTFFNHRSKFCCEDFLFISRSNILRTPDSPPKNGKFTAMLWNLKEEVAENTEYRINEDYLSGLVESVKIDGTT